MLFNGSLQKSRIIFLSVIGSLIIIISSSSVLAAKAAPATPNANYGVNGTSSVLQAPNATTRRAALADMKSLGVKYVRIDVTWSYIEPTRGNYQWSYYDSVMTDIKNSGLTPIMILAYGNTAYGSTTNYGPAPLVSDYTNWAKKVVGRYSKSPYSFHVYEVWNEPNLNQFWNNAPSASGYTALLKDAYVGIKSVDPASTILSAGIAPSGMASYVQAMYANGAKGYFDALAAHPYVGEGWDSIEAVRATMIANGDSSKKIWATEFGWSSWNTPGNSESLQASRITQFANYWRTFDGHGPLVIYTHKDTGTDLNNPEYNFGLIRYNGSKKPAWNSLYNLTKLK